MPSKWMTVAVCDDWREHKCTATTCANIRRLQERMKQAITHTHNSFMSKMRDVGMTWRNYPLDVHVHESQVDTLLDQAKAQRVGFIMFCGPKSTKLHGTHPVFLMT